MKRLRFSNSRYFGKRNTVRASCPTPKATVHENIIKIRPSSGFRRALQHLPCVCPSLDRRKGCSVIAIDPLCFSRRPFAVRAFSIDGHRRQRTASSLVPGAQNGFCTRYVACVRVRAGGRARVPPSRSTTLRRRCRHSGRPSSVVVVFVVIVFHVVSAAAAAVVAVAVGRPNPESVPKSESNERRRRRRVHARVSPASSLTLSVAPCERTHARPFFR